MEQVSVRMSKKMVADIQKRINKGHYTDKSEAIRDAVRHMHGVCED